MKNTISLVLLIVFISFKSIAKDPVTWKPDAVHSNLGFSTLHLSSSDIKGTVQLKTGAISATKESFSEAVINIKAT